MSITCCSSPSAGPAATVFAWTTSVAGVFVLDPEPVVNDTSEIARAAKAVMAITPAASFVFMVFLLLHWQDC
jgi:hypothetical protein